MEDSDYLYKGKVTSDNEDENAVRNKEVTSKLNLVLKRLYFYIQNFFID